MPLPLLPWVLIILSGAAGAKGVIDTMDASDRIDAAQKSYQRRKDHFDHVYRRYQNEHKMAQEKFYDLGQVRLESLITLGKAVDFIKKAKLKDRELEEKLNITPQEMKLWKQASVSAKEVIGGMGSAAASGLATASGVYGLVGLLGTASTGTAIGTLAGAAASNATLAWLGGGAIAAGGGGMALGAWVLGGLVAGPAILVTGFFAQGKAEEIETEVAKAIADMEIKEAEIKRQLGILDVILQRVDELKMSTISLDSKLERLLENSDPSDLRDVYKVAEVAKGLGCVLDIAILDNNGNLTC